MDVAGWQPALLEAHLPGLIAQGAAVMPLAKVRGLVAAIGQHVPQRGLRTIDVVIAFGGNGVAQTAGDKRLLLKVLAVTNSSCSAQLRPQMNHMPHCLAPTAPPAPHLR